MSQSTISSAIAEPYAEALISLAQQHNLLDRFGQDVSLMLEMLKSSEDLSVVLANPFVPGDTKKSILTQLLSSQVHEYILKFLLVLVDRRRIAFLEGVCQHFQALQRQLTNTELAEVTSAIALNDAQRSAVIDKVKAMTGARQVELSTTIDSDLLGGVIIKVGSQVLDASIRGQLRRLTTSMGSSS